MDAGWVRAREVIRRWGWNVTSYQILNPGFAFWTSTQHDAVVGYIERHDVRVVGGAPVCADDRLRDVMHAFERDAAAAGKGVVYFCAEERLAALAASAADRTTFMIGAQPFFAPSELLRELHDHASLRAQLHRARNKGVTVRALTSRAPADLHVLQQCLEEWKALRGLPPLHFLVETQTLVHLDDRLLVVAERAQNVIGFSVATPIPARRSWLIEQIVRTRGAPNGTAELLVSGVAGILQERHAQTITFGLAPLAHRAAPLVDQAPGWLRALLAALRAHGRRFYNFEGLEAFKAKFRPAQWAPVYASTAPGTTLPRALLAITTAFSGEPLRWFIPHTLARMIGQEARRVMAPRVWTG
jgi:phosphatidylglycerol lysyltransferase